MLPLSLVSIPLTVQAEFPKICAYNYLPSSFPTSFLPSPSFLPFILLAYLSSAKYIFGIFLFSKLHISIIPLLKTNAVKSSKIINILLEFVIFFTIL